MTSSDSVPISLYFSLDGTESHWHRTRMKALLSTPRRGGLHELQPGRDSTNSTAPKQYHKRILVDPIFFAQRANGRSYLPPREINQSILPQVYFSFLFSSEKKDTRSNFMTPAPLVNLKLQQNTQSHKHQALDICLRIESMNTWPISSGPSRQHT